MGFFWKLAVERVVMDMKQDTPAQMDDFSITELEVRLEMAAVSAETASSCDCIFRGVLCMNDQA
jgi:hypothetical protein